MLLRGSRQTKTDLVLHPLIEGDTTLNHVTNHCNFASDQLSNIIMPSFYGAFDGNRVRRVNPSPYLAVSHVLQQPRGGEPSK